MAADDEDTVAVPTPSGTACGCMAPEELREDEAAAGECGVALTADGAWAAAE
jgi:hypothetical protein